MQLDCENLQTLKRQALEASKANFLKPISTESQEQEKPRTPKKFMSRSRISTINFFPSKTTGNIT